MKISPARKITLAFLAIFTLGLIVYGALRQQKKRLPEFIQAERRNVSEIVSATGKVVAENSVSLAFERGGKVVEHQLKVGDKIKHGDILAKLDEQELSQKVKEQEASRLSALGAEEQALAALAREKTRLSEILRGARKEELELAQIKLRGAKEDLDNAELSLSALQNQRLNDEAKAEEEKKDARINLKTVEEKANIDLQNFYDDTNDISANAYTLANDAIRNQIDALFSDDASGNPHLTFGTSDTQLRASVENERAKAEITLNEMKLDLLINANSEETSKELIEKMKTHLSEILSFLRDLYRATDEAASISDATILSYQTSVNTATTNINTAIANNNNHAQSISVQKAVNSQAITTAQTRLNSAIASQKTASAGYDSKIATGEGALQSAKIKVEIASEELRLKQAGATAEEIQSQMARVKEQEAAVSSARARTLSEDASTAGAKTELQKMTLVSPIDGIITSDAIEIGEIAAPNTTIITIIGNTPYQIEVFIPEIDIVKLELGDASEITLDAYGDDLKLIAKIIMIEPAETLIEGVATYKIKLAFENSDERVKPGMTANIEIVTDKRENVIAIPARLVVNENTDRYVKIADQSGAVLKRDVVIGLLGSDGYVEIKEGLQEDEQVVIMNE